MTVRVALLVPRRPDGGHRDRLWHFCRAYWRREFFVQNWEIVEADHVDGPFNRGAAVNDAARTADAGRIAELWDVAVIVDSDVILDADQVRAGVELAAATGRLVLPYTRRMDVGPHGTRRILDGYVGAWDSFARPHFNRAHCSSCVIVPRALWDRVGGFDVRFAGYGGEDDAFHAACSVLGDGIERVPGDVWHLWHRPGGGTSRANRLLWHRYRDSATPDAMRTLVGEPRTADQVVAVVLTNGARDTLGKTVESFDRMVTGPIGRKVIVADRCAPSFDGWDTVKVRGGGYTRAVIAALDVAIGSGQPWVFFSEDDFTYERPVDLTALQAAMIGEPRLAQMSLKRQAWYPDELAAGGIVEARTARGDRFVQRDGWVEHAAYWTMNPMLTTRVFLAEHPWPNKTGSENRMTVAVFHDDAEPLAGIWGRIDDPPIVTHTGQTRAGTGY